MAFDWIIHRAIGINSNIYNLTIFFDKHIKKIQIKGSLFFKLCIFSFTVLENESKHKGHGHYSNK